MKSRGRPPWLECMADTRRDNLGKTLRIATCLQSLVPDAPDHGAMPLVCQARACAQTMHQLQPRRGLRLAQTRITIKGLHGRAFGRVNCQRFHCVLAARVEG